MNRSVDVRIEIEGISDEDIEVSRVEGVESISKLFEFEVLTVLGGSGWLDPDQVIGRTAALVFERDGAEVRRIFGMIAEVCDRLDSETDFSTYRMRFVPRAFRLTLVETLDVFLDASVPDILRQKLAGYQMKEIAAEARDQREDHDYELRLYRSYPAREFVVQYKETDLAFISRLCEHLGISYFFEHKHGRDVLIFTDEPSGFSLLAEHSIVPFRARGDRVDVFRFEATTRLIPSHYVVRDYNYRTPQIVLTGEADAPVGEGSIVEYGAHVKTPEEATQMARIRAEERLAARRVFEGSSDIPGLRPGSTFKLEGHPRGDMDLLLVEVAHKAALVTKHDGVGAAPNYQNEIKAIQKSQPFRPPRVTPKPKIHGVVTGVIDAQEKSDYAKVDDQGRYLVRFVFDTHTANEKQASRWVRMAQPHSGQGYGMHFPLRQGVEVILTFVDGDPDRPIIAATVPNPQTASPVTSGNAPRNIIRTGAGNEINIDDSKDSQRIKMMTPFKNTSFQLGANNSPEDGAILETQGANSQIAMTASASFTSLNASISAVKNFLSSGQITTVADINWFVTSATSVKELMNIGLDLADAALDQQAAELKKKEGELNKESILKQKTSKEKEDKRFAERKETEAAVANLEGMVESDAALEAKKQAYLDAKAQYESDLLNYQTNVEWLTEAKKGEWIPKEGESQAHYTFGSASQVRYYTGEVETSRVATFGADGRGGSKKAYEDAEREYLAALRSAPRKPGVSAAQLTAAADAADEAAAERTAAESAADTAWDEADLAKNNYNTQVGLNETGDKAIEIKKHKQNVAYAKTASVLFSEVMTIYATVKEFIESFKKEKTRAEALATAVLSMPREATAHLLADVPVKPYRLLGEIKHTIGSEGNTAIYAKKELFSWAETAILLGKTGVLIETDKHLALLSKKTAEIAARDKLTITTEELDARTYTSFKLVAAPMIGGATGTIELQSKSKMSFESTHDDISVTANKTGKKIVMSAEDEISGKAKKVSLAAVETAHLLAGAGANPAWGLKVDGRSGKVSLGKVTGNWKLDIKEGTVGLGGSNVGLKVEDGKVTVIGSEKVQLNGNSFMANAKKIQLA
jgi:type VI secretion system secreted protein VgrG